MAVILQSFEELVDLGELEVYQLVLEQHKQTQSDVEDESGAKRQQVVPDSDAQAQGKTVEEQSHEPLVHPHLVGQHLLLEVKK